MKKSKKSNTRRKSKLSPRAQKEYLEMTAPRKSPGKLSPKVQAALKKAGILKTNVPLDEMSEGEALKAIKYYSEVMDTSVRMGR